MVTLPLQELCNLGRLMQVSVRLVVNGIQAGILELMWDASKLVFYDFNPTPNSRSSIFSTATFYPPKFLPRNPSQGTYNRTFPTTFVGWTRLMVSTTYSSRR